jgi:hypothetical protein
MVEGEACARLASEFFYDLVRRSPKRPIETTAVFTSFNKRTWSPCNLGKFVEDTLVVGDQRHTRSVR